MKYKNRSVRRTLDTDIDQTSCLPESTRYSGTDRSISRYFQIYSRRFKEERNKGVPLSRYGNRWLLKANRRIDRVIFHWLNWPVETNHVNPPHNVTKPTWINCTSPWFTCSCPMIFIEEFYYPISNRPHTETSPEIATPFSEQTTQSLSPIISFWGGLAVVTRVR